MEAKMQAYRIEKIISRNSELVLKGLPFQPGETVEVLILPRQKNKNYKTGNAESLKGAVLKYEKPFEPVAQDDWNVIK